MNSFYLSEIGRVRELNEDVAGSFLNLANQKLILVADGMGGHQAGEVASALARDIIKEKWQKTSEVKQAEKVEGWIKEAAYKANQVIYDYQKEQTSLEGMGTTLVIAVCLGEFITIGHVGDSRAYLLSEENMKQLTEDHTLVSELVKSGEISSEEAKNHPRRNLLTRALGTEKDIKIDVKTISWEVTDTLLLCSDGLSNKLTANEMREVLQKGTSLKVIAETLIDLANERGGEDNITVALMRKLKAGENKC